MRPDTRYPHFLAGLVVLAGISAYACVAPQRQPVGAGEAIEVPTQPPAPAQLGGDDPLADPIATADVSDGGGAAVEPLLPVGWSAASTFGHTRPFAEAIAKATDARKSFDRASLVIFAAGDGGASTTTMATTITAKDFERLSSLLDQASRLYAAAYHAPNATMSNRVNTLRDAGDMILAWSRKLDEAGLARAPATFRSDPSVALTFEDVANGPAKRWREEGLALVSMCFEIARANKIDSDQARDCGAMRRSYARVIAAQRPSPSARASMTATDAGSPNACACDPGDPLCSASMSGWCRPK